MADSLKPCRFCGGPIHAEKTTIAELPWAVHCPNGLCATGSVLLAFAESEEAAVTLYNREPDRKLKLPDAEWMSRKIASDPDLETEAGTSHWEAPYSPTPVSPSAGKEEWVTVPRKPTREMLLAAHDRSRDGTTPLHFKTWDAMIAAAPRPVSPDRGLVERVSEAIRSKMWEWGVQLGKQELIVVAESAVATLSAPPAGIAELVAQAEHWITQLRLHDENSPMRDIADCIESLATALAAQKGDGE